MSAIERAAPGDAPALKRLLEAAYRGDSARRGWNHEADILDDERVTAEELAGVLADPHTAMLVAREGDALVGCVAVTRKGAHLAYLGLPIAGDLRYGGGPGPRDLQRQFLHAARLTLERPSDGRRLAAWSELPADLVASLDDVGISSAALPGGVGARVVDADG